jgi:hypothetical protein
MPDDFRSSHNEIFPCWRYRWPSGAYRIIHTSPGVFAQNDWPVVDFDVRENVILFQLHGADLRQPDFHLAYVGVPEIQALTIHDAAPIAHAISFGAVAAPAGPAPTRLELRKRLDDYSKELTDRIGQPIGYEADWEAFGQSEEALRVLAVSIGNAHQVLCQIVMEDVGKEAFLQAIKKVRFLKGYAADIRLTEQCLSVQLDPTNLTGQLGRADLSKRINDLL